jgi:N-glycosidase YbiA
MEASTDIVYFYTRTMPFWGLSNFSPPGFEADGVYWPTVEHYFQAHKFLDSANRERIRKAATPKLARELGQSRATPLRPGWDELRDQVMLEALRLKFQQPAARDVLLSTVDRLLVEASPYDYYWAAGEDGSGLNRLGHLLMQVRAEIRSAV